VAATAGVLALVAVVLMAFLWTIQRRLIYLPSAAVPPSAAEVIDGAKDVRLHTSDGLTLGGWLVPAQTPRSGITVLVTPGNAADRSARAPLARALAARGFAVLLFDYRGYGGNAGSPSEQGLADDARAARAYLVGEAGVAPDRLLYFGESLGAAVAVGLAAEHPPAGLVLRSPFVDLAAVARVHYPYLPARFLLRDRYPVAEQLRGVKVPTAVVYGTRDSVIPPVQSIAVAEAAAGPVRVVRIDGADHNDPALTHGPAVVDAIAAVTR
jgi:fermentation-respiration switch protein FrsA (DUF1100 family)